MAAALVLVTIGISLALTMRQRGRDEGARCGAGFARRGARCLSVGNDGAACPAPLSPSPRGCDAPDVRILVPAAAITLGPSDWEAEGRVLPRTIRAGAFRVDAFEATRGRYAGAVDPDAARAASGMTRSDAAGYCAGHGGRLPSEDEWILAAASAQSPPRRYPWGDTGAVCRRAAWGLATGPCAETARGAGSMSPDGVGADTVGAHPDGDSPLGLHDIAGNVAEWVAEDGARPGLGIAKGGSWQSALASELRIWSRLELDPRVGDPRVGFRCVYSP